MSNKAEDENAKMIETAAFLRLGEFDQIDVPWLEDIVLSMSRNEQNKVKGKARILIAHLLKFKYQSSHRSGSWTSTILNQRDDLADLLEDSATLQNVLRINLVQIYRKARNLATLETGLNSTFPLDCEWTLDQILDTNFWPDKS